MVTRVTSYRLNSDSSAPRRALFLPHLDVLAHTGRSLLIARELVRRGWFVAFGGEGRYARLVSGAGIEVKPLPEMPATALVRESRSGRRWPFHSADQIRPFVAAEVECMKKFHPDVVVFDHRYSAGTSAEVMRIPRVAITNLWWTPYDTIGMGLPETYPLFIAMPRLRFIRRYAIARAVAKRVTSFMFWRWIKPYNIVRAEYNLPPLRSILDLFDGDAVILPDTPELMPSKNLPMTHHYVGPLVWEPTGSLPDELANVTGYVYVTMGSSADPKVFDTAIEALKLLNVAAIVTTGGVRKIEEFGTLPPHIKLYDFLPGSAAAANASVVVCQGGIGTIYQALANGKPLVGVPFMPEQEVYGIGAVERAGAGRALSAHSLTPQLLADTIDAVRSDPRYTSAAKALSLRIDPSSGPFRSADIVEKLVSSNRGAAEPVRNKSGEGEPTIWLDTKGSS